MDIQQLRMFQSIVECGSMAQAATKLHCVPSNITTRIKQLEQELKAPLFLREGKPLNSLLLVRFFWNIVKKF